jgi:hypothetical protein
MIITKAQERRIREVIRLVHERRLAESIALVEEAIRFWKAGEASVFEIDEAIRKHSDRARHHFIRYANTPAIAPEAVGILDEALALGMIDQEEYRRLTTFK